MKRNNIVFMFSLCIIIFATSCKSDYDKYVHRELATGIQNDSLIFDMKIGQTMKDFFGVCWKLNEQQVISQGTGNQTARFTEKEEDLEDPTKKKDMLFYGIFDENKVMQGMEMTYHYTTWAPWNKGRHSDSLAIHLKDIYMEDYKGNDFITIDLVNIEFDAYVKIDGNRQILIYPINQKDVKVKMMDLNAKLGKK